VNNLGEKNKVEGRRRKDEKILKKDNGTYRGRK
jgi:hypothetical protein